MLNLAFGLESCLDLSYCIDCQLFFFVMEKAECKNVKWKTRRFNYVFC